MGWKESSFFFSDLVDAFFRLTFFGCTRAKLTMRLFANFLALHGSKR
jgi:hypothetical protein